MKNQVYYSLIIASLISLSGFRSIENKIEWLTLEQAYAKVQKEPRKVYIDVYTSWCGWCKVMDKNTFASELVSSYTNKKFYAVKFDAESTADIKIGNKVYKYDAKSKSHQAAIALMNGQMSYPTIVFLDEKFNMLQPLPGYRDAKQFHQVITWFGDGFNKTVPFETYVKGTYVKNYASK